MSKRDEDGGKTWLRGADGHSGGKEKGANPIKYSNCLPMGVVKVVMNNERAVFHPRVLMAMRMVSKLAVEREGRRGKDLLCVCVYVRER